MHGTKRFGRAILLALLLSLSVPVHAQCARGSEYKQSEAVKARYPDPAVEIDTPALAPGRTTFTSYEELMAWVEALAARSENVQLRTAGYTQELRRIPALVFSSDRRFSPDALRRSDRPVVLLAGQLHGNEPAGGEALLAVARALAEGELRPLLDRITVVIVPRGNPDGAQYFWRGTARCVDVNRDHVKVDLPETAALRRLALELQPDVVIDAHEFSVATRWIEKFGAIQHYDFTTAYATHPNVAPELTTLAESVFSRNLSRDVDRAGYSHFWYYTTGYDPKDLRVNGGGTAPDIGRNYAGLQHALSFLVESRGVGIGRDSFKRRVHTHYVVMSSLLRTTADNAREVRRVVRSARESIVQRGREPRADDLIAVTLKTPSRKQTLTMLDPASGELKAVEVDWIDPREATAGLSRSRPHAYLVLPSHTEVARRLALAGAEVRVFQTPAELEVESYEATERRGGNVYVEGHVRSTVSTEVTTRRRTFPAGTFLFTMAQPAANILAAALEPESTSSFVSWGIVPVDRRGLANPQEAAPSEVPIYRLMKPAGVETRVLFNPQR